jgi:phage/plasmid-associated DNA primase
MDEQNELPEASAATETLSAEALAAGRYAGLIQQLVLDKSSYNTANDYTALHFKVFVRGDVRDMLTTECAGGYQQCNGKGNCGGMWCPRQRFTDELVDLIIRQANEPDEEDDEEDDDESAAD